MKKVLKLLAVMLTLCLVMTGCMESDPNGQNPANPNAVYDESYKLRDLDALYTMYEPEDVVTMYLTVSTGNEGERTNHTWSEINTYSVYDYEDMGVDRYRVEGLLQIGDDTGPLPGEVGYGQLSPNCTVQIRGQSSSKQPVKNYKIALKDNKGTWMGNTSIPLTLIFFTNFWL